MEKKSGKTYSNTLLLIYSKNIPNPVLIAFQLQVPEKMRLLHFNYGLVVLTEV